MNGAVTDYTAGLWLGVLDPVWFLLFVTDPGRSGAIHSEVVGGSYNRLKGTMTAVTDSNGRSIWLASKLVWTGMPDVYVSHVGIADAAVNGHLLAYSLLPEPHPHVAQGASFVLEANTFAVTVGLPA